MKTEESDDTYYDYCPDVHGNDVAGFSGAIPPSETPEKRCRGRERLWMKDVTLPSAAEALAMINSEAAWGKDSGPKKTLAGDKYYYRCKQLPYRAEAKCPAQLYLLYHAESAEVSIFRTPAEHCHVGNCGVGRGLSEDVRTAVRDLYDSEVRKPNAIIRCLAERGFPMPEKTQLVNFLNRHRMESRPTATISISELEAWCGERAEMPDPAGQPHRPFVIARNIDCHRQELQFVLSTARLLSNAACNNCTLHVDATERLVWQGYPVYVLGVSGGTVYPTFQPVCMAICTGARPEDFRFVFHALATAIARVATSDDPAWQPCRVVSDASDAIATAVSDVFGAATTHTICPAHVMSSIDRDRRFTALQLSARQALRAEIDLLRSIDSVAVFAKAGHLFVEKWRTTEDADDNADTAAFVDYFEQTWLHDHPHWHRRLIADGGGVGSASNVSIKRLNATVKREHSLRERLPVGQFLAIAVAVLEGWSAAKPFDGEGIETTSIPRRIWVDAAVWAGQRNAPLIAASSRDGDDEVGCGESASPKTSTSTSFFAVDGADGVDDATAASSSSLVGGGGHALESAAAMVAAYNADMAAAAWRTFADFVATFRSVWRVEVGGSTGGHADGGGGDGDPVPGGVSGGGGVSGAWRRVRCGCPAWWCDDRGVCRHSLGVALRLGLCTAPAGIGRLSSEPPRKRGRPSQAKAVLI